MKSITRRKSEQRTAIKYRLKQVMSVLLTVYFMAISMMPPQQAFALTGGPSQPEVQSFEPIGTSEMVDLFSGDFTYNIPLLDVGGYPINLSYHSGITMDQEASWVGLGWNINPGVINRGLRGLPDDFNGDIVTNETYMEPNKTIGMSYGPGVEVTGAVTPGLSTSIGINFNNYKGINAELGITPSLKMAAFGSGQLNAGLGFSSSSDGGLSISPSVSYSAEIEREGKKDRELGGGIGTSFNRRSGLKELTISANTNIGFTKSKTFKRKDGKDGITASFSGALSGSSSFDFGQPTYSPSVATSMSNFNFSASFKTGASAGPVFVNATIRGYYSKQKIKEGKNEVKSPSYGYMYSHYGQDNSSSLMDFNREKDGTFSTYSKNIAVPNATYDMFGVSGQGVGGSYRPFRSDFGYLFDGETVSSIGNSVSLGGELGGGFGGHLGFDVAYTRVKGGTNPWKKRNKAIEKYKYKIDKPYSDYEPFYFKEANEKSVMSDKEYYLKSGGDRPVRFKISPIAATFELEKTLVDNSNNSYNANAYRKKRERRSQVLSFLNNEDLKKGLGVGEMNNSINSKPNHHIGEITTLGTDGSRYVYGLPAYNLIQEDVTFSVGGGLNQSSSYITDEVCKTGLVTYFPERGDNSKKNKNGIDHYYNKKTTPEYAHSYMLTEVLSPDYVDADQIKGPSIKDLGNYTQFKYSKIDNYKWRTPLGYRKATYNEGLITNQSDDKASYIYGEKELWYLDTIKTKNYIAIFHKEDRNDACAVVDKDGAIDETSSMKLLEKISLYSRVDYDKATINDPAIPIKEVHFEYDYSLCRGILNNNNDTIPSSHAYDNETENLGGKLTLRRVYFTYRNSKKGQLSPYTFNYNDKSNPNYNITSYDRWGNYKRNKLTACGYDNNNQPLSNAEYSYVEQELGDGNVTDTINNNVAAWSMTNIQLPSGGEINVEYESDDYAFVQDKPAMQMYKIIGTSKEGETTVDTLSPLQSVSKNNNGDLEDNRKVYFEMNQNNTNIEDYTRGIEDVYFRCLMQYERNNGNENTHRKDFVPGYGVIDSVGVIERNSKKIGWILFKHEKLKKGSLNNNTSPIALAGIQFGRLHLSRYVWQDPNIDASPFQLSLSILVALSEALVNFGTGFESPNKYVWRRDMGTEIYINKSWLRLNNVVGKKFGGGVRVKKITMSDQWSEMTEDGTNFAYGQEYSYEGSTGKSTGVASYEPMIGGDENPFRKPIFETQEVKMAPDERFFKEEPYGESFFPSPSVGYSKVEVVNISGETNSDNQYTSTETGSTVEEFYTTKDFPTIAKRTVISPPPIRTRIEPPSIMGFGYSRDFLTLSQGFSIILNDMNGKPKKQAVYQEKNEDEPISSVEYKYKQQGTSGSTQFSLKNDATVIFPNGTKSDEQIGIHYDIYSDMRQSRNDVVGGSIGVNLDIIPIPFIPFLFPLGLTWPSLTVSETQFRSAAVTKVVQKFGIIDEVIATDLSSKVSTKTLAYDAETGSPLLTKTKTNFEDDIYTLNYPAYWHYDKMGPAYKNIGFEANDLSFVSGVAQFNNAKKYFVEGDEIKFSNTSITEKAWIIEVNDNDIKAVDKAGYLINGQLDVKVLRSGRKNMLSSNMASITTLTNPLDRFENNIYENVLQASAIEYTDEWKTHCDCFSEEINGNTTNPYILGTKGYFKPKTSYVHLTSRSQTENNNNTNIRKDGVFDSYTPFYELNPNDNWVINRKNWTYTAEVTEFSPYGPELENRDALGRYSSANFGFNQTLPTAVAANSRYQEIGYDSFEDYDYNPCADDHFKIDEDDRDAIDTIDAHSGYYSVVVTNDNSVKLSRQINEQCDDDECDLKMSLKCQRWERKRIRCFHSISGGVKPYTIEYEILSGNPIINIDYINDRVITEIYTDNYTITVTDANGCQEVYQRYTGTGIKGGGK